MGFSDYLKDVEREMTTLAKPKQMSQPAPTRKPVILKRPVVETVIEEEEELDEYLVENDWKFRNNIWVDPITKNRLIYEAAYAVQQERDRLVAMPVVESRGGVVAQTRQQQQPPQSIMSYAASVLSEDGETLYENDAIAQTAMYSGATRQDFPPVGDVPQQAAADVFYGGEEARMLAEAEAQAFSDGASMSGVSMAPTRHNGGMMAHASSLF